MSNVLSKKKKQQVIALGRLGWSLRRIEKAGAYSARNRRSISPGCGNRGAYAGWVGTRSVKPAIEVSTDSEAENLPRQPSRSPSASACEPYFEIIEDALAKGRNAMAIWQDLVDGHGFAGRYASVKRFVRKLSGTSAPEARVVIETAPGEEAQVDYGTGPMVRDPQTGKYRRTRGMFPDISSGPLIEHARLCGLPVAHLSGPEMSIYCFDNLSQ